MDRILLPLTRPRWRDVATLAAWVALTAFVVQRGIVNPHLSSDGAAYWSVRDGVLYGGHWLQERDGLPVPYVYSPAFAQAIMPLVQLPLAVWMALLVTAQTLLVAWLAGPILAAALVWTWFPLWGTNLWAGHIYPLMAAALALTPRYPAAWSFLLLTKVTPGVGLVWYAVRREWRLLAIASGVTVIIAGVSFALTPGDWLAWLEVLRDGAGRQGGGLVLPLSARLPLSAGLIAVAAWRGWRFLLPVGVALALPQVGWSATPLLLAAVYWWRRAEAPH